MPKKKDKGRSPAILEDTKDFDGFRAPSLDPEEMKRLRELYKRRKAKRKKKKEPSRSPAI